MHYKCADCGATYDGDLRQNWGRTKETSGYGPQMVCINVTPTGPGGAGEVCRGALAIVADDSTRAAEGRVTSTPLGSSN